MVTGEDLPDRTCRVVEQDEVLEEAEEVPPVADPLEQRLHVHGAGFLFGEPLPLVEVPPLAGDRADLRALAVREHHDRVVVEEVRDRVAVVAVVLLERDPQIPVDVLALDEEQRQPVDEADQIGPPAVEVTADRQFADREEVVVLRGLEVENPETAFRRFPACVGEGHRDAVAEEVVLLAVGGDDGLRGVGGDELAHGIVVGGPRESGVQRRERRPERAGQHHLAVRVAAEQAVGSEVLPVVGVHRLPAEAFLQAFGRRLLNEIVLGVRTRRHGFRGPPVRPRWPRAERAPSP